MKKVWTINEMVEDIRKEILTEWTEAQQNTFFLAEYSSQSLINYHHSLGMYIRNKYDLWSRPWTPELKDGVDYSPEHPDSISMVVIQEAWKLGPNKQNKEKK